MSAPGYQCPLTGQLYQSGTEIEFHINGDAGRWRKGFLMKCAEGGWKVLSASGEILPIDAKGRAVAPQSIRKALA